MRLGGGRERDLCALEVGLGAASGACAAGRGRRFALLRGWPQRWRPLRGVPTRRVPRALMCLSVRRVGWSDRRWPARRPTPRGGSRTRRAPLRPRTPRRGRRASPRASAPRWHRTPQLRACERGTPGGRRIWRARRRRTTAHGQRCVGALPRAAPRRQLLSRWSLILGFFFHRPGFNLGAIGIVTERWDQDSAAKPLRCAPDCQGVESFRTRSHRGCTIGNDLLGLSP